MIKICFVVSNSLKKDPRVIKQIYTAKKFSYDCIFIGLYDDNYDKVFLDNLHIKYDLVKLPNEFSGKLNSLRKKIIRARFKNNEFRNAIIKHKPDIIHANDFDTLWPSYKAAKKLKARIIYDSHEIWIENNEFSSRKIYKKIMFYIEKYLIKRVDAVVSVSNSSANYLSCLYKINLPLIITNVPMINYTNLLKNNDSFEVLYHGLITQNRGYEEFVMSSKLLDNGIKLIVRGYGSLRSCIEDIIINNDLKEKVFLDDAVEISDLIPLASKSHIGVVLTKPININYKLTISNKIFEYVHAGLPVILSNTPEHQYFNEKFKIGIVIKDVKPENIAEAINFFYRNPEFYLECLMGTKKMVAEMNWENEEQKLNKLYIGLINEKK